LAIPYYVLTPVHAGSGSRTSPPTASGVAIANPQSLGLCTFLYACARGCTLAQAAEAAIQADPTQDIAQLLSELITAGALSPATPSHYS